MMWKLIQLSSLLLGALVSPTRTCRIHNSGRSADCVGRQLSAVPRGQLPSTLQDVDLSYNNLQAVHADDLLRLPLLRILQLQFNNISHIHTDAFKHNPLLESLNVFNNSLEEIPAGALTPLSDLKQLLMSNNLYKHATLAESFSKLVKLQVLSMGGPLVMGLKKADFLPLKNIRLQSFAIKCSSNLSYYEPGSLEVIRTRQMGFDMAVDQQPGVLVHMLHDIANNNFSVIQFRNLFEYMYYTGEEDIFQGLKDINALQLIIHRGKFNEHLLRMALMNLQIGLIRRLRVQYIDFARSPTFSDTGASSWITNLTIDKLDLWYISNPDVLRFDWRFTWFNKIKQLSIRYVYFNYVPCDSWVEMEGVELLDISYCRLQSGYIFNQRCENKGTMPNLHTFNASSNELTSLEDLSVLTSDFRQLKVLDVSNNKLGSAEDSRDCVWTNITHLIAHHNQFVSEALLCLPTTVQHLDLSHCDLDQLDTTFFEKATELRELLLSGNKIKFIPSKWTSPHLQFLALDGNSFGLISKASFQGMPELSGLRAGNNPYHCTCELHAFVQETMSQGTVNLTDWPWNYRCYHPEAFLNTVVSQYLPSRVACDMKLVILISVATTAAVILILMLICYVFDLPWYTKATYQIIRAKYRAHKEKAAGAMGTFTYHAFISYSHADADWVRDQLLPCLENSRNPYRLCIHERDFMPGRWIIDNIIENIENSRKSIFVLSRHFVNSDWCNYELYFAQQRAMGKTFSDVILVVKEPIDPSSLPSKYCRLKKMLSTKTYLEWPQQVSQQPFFWEQLRSVLGRPTLPGDGGQSVQSRTPSVSVIRCPEEDSGAKIVKCNQEEVNSMERNNNKLSNPRTQIPIRFYCVPAVSCFDRLNLIFCVLHLILQQQVTVQQQESTRGGRHSGRPAHRTETMSGHLQEAMTSLIGVFHSYSGQEGDKYKLNRRELKCLLKQELSDLLSASKDPMVVERIMSELDENQDGEVDFQEFVVLVAALTVACNDFFIDCEKSGLEGSKKK
ncbi:toll-like receptor 18 [Pleuronectes platessa]|uniref:toll-like receptor 18 n=1 Tax=Pleuronectes platessa TaxID=8262 RepID=UPI00232A6AC5|nr:toll-like receptor 18 [Pleuronectes platessa]